MITVLVYYRYPLGVSLSTHAMCLPCAAEWRSMLDKLEAANADKSNTQSKLDEIVLQDSSTKVCVCVRVRAYMCACIRACVCVILMTQVIYTYIIECTVYSYIYYLFVQLREQLFEQEKKLLQSQNEWLNTELNSKTEALLKLQKDRVSNICLLIIPSLSNVIR